MACERLEEFKNDLKDMNLKTIVEDVMYRKFCFDDLKWIVRTELYANDYHLLDGESLEEKTKSVIVLQKEFLKTEKSEQVTKLDGEIS